MVFFTSHFCDIFKTAIKLPIMGFILKEKDNYSSLTKKPKNAFLSKTQVLGGFGMLPKQVILMCIRDNSIDF